MNARLERKKVEATLKPNMLWFLRLWCYEKRQMSACSVLSAGTVAVESSSPESPAPNILDT